ncbi:MAG: aminopeptidase P family protein, partial [Anaeroplasmataceae bacterium]|nr:aminopeptidase P family protein [Anaeroplasmataceae bacterium]
LLYEYEDFYTYIASFMQRKILLDFNKVNYAIFTALSEKNTLSNHPDPTLLMKAIKNEKEIENTIFAHIKDGVAFTKLMYYVKTSIQEDNPMTELSVTSYLHKLRQSQDSFVDISFDTICAYKEHAAMMHYSATPESNYTLEASDLLLIDSGGHYLDGTTDITRTLALGTLSENQKLHFTTVLKSVIALSEAVFLKGVKGLNLDILARGPIWKLLIDYKCGTGHGVGYLLSVHEAPNGFRWQIVPERNDSAEFVPGMITTNEPGIYLENKYGIRIENEMVCVEKGKNEFGEFLGFETITLAPIDLDAIDTSLLSESEKTWLNQYHKRVYDELSPYLEDEEKEWLKIYTREI